MEPVNEPSRSTWANAGGNVDNFSSMWRAYCFSRTWPVMMASSIEWHGQNKLLNSPKEADYPVLNVFNNGQTSVSCWQLTETELTDIIKSGGKLFVAVLGGSSQYPMFVGTEDSVRSVVADTGKVWKRANDIPVTKLPKIIDNQCPNCKISMSDCERPKHKYCPTCDTIWNVVN